MTTPAERVRAVYPDAVADRFLYEGETVCEIWNDNRTLILGRGPSEPTAWIDAAALLDATAPMIEQPDSGDTPA